MIAKGRPKTIKEPKRCDFREKLVQISLKIPENLLKNLNNIVAENNPEPFYNRNHYIICAILKQNKEFLTENRGVLTENPPLNIIVAEKRRSK